MEPKKITPEQIAELRAALAVLPMLSMLGGEGWPDTGVDWPLAPQSSAVPLPKGERPTIIAATPEIQRAVWMLRNAAPALLDAAERCAELERRFANLEMHSCAVAKAADRMRAHEKVQDEMLRAAIARAEAAEKAERARVVAYLRDWAKLFNGAGDYTEALTDAADEIERGDHAKGGG